MKKITVCLLIGAMAASMLTGCGSNGGSSDSSDSKADSSSETMTIMMNGSDSDAYMEGYRKIIDGFNESNEYGVKVEIQNVTNSDYKTKLTTMMASDSETDIIFTWELGYLENFVNGDKIVSLQKYLDEYLKEYPERELDYVHSEAAAERIAKDGRGCAMILGAFDKSSLFDAIEAGGVLPRKTFSIGEDIQKRYYMECRKLTK